MPLLVVYIYIFVPEKGLTEPLCQIILIIFKMESQEAYKLTAYVVLLRYDTAKQMTADHFLHTPLFFSGMERLITRFKRFWRGAPEQLLTIEGGLEDIRQAFFEGNLKKS